MTTDWLTVTEAQETAARLTGQVRCPFCGQLVGFYAPNSGRGLWLESHSQLHDPTDPCQGRFRWLRDAIQLAEDQKK
jgi:hypothetical protein